MILETNIPVIEVPPIPAGYTFMACLTHDVDFVGIRNHKFDHTFFGFLYRAVWQTFLDVVRRKIPITKLVKNWNAVLALPFVYFGLAKDFMSQFDKYLEIEKGLPSTFFIMPFKNMPGEAIDGQAPKKRAGPYDIDDIKPQLELLIAEGCEIGLHGIDAWCNREKRPARVGAGFWY